MVEKSCPCRVCGSSAYYIFKSKLIGLTVSYFECSDCGYVQTEHPYWLDKAYAEAINVTDTGIMARNQVNARIVLLTLMMLRGLNKRLVDCAGGYGILVRLLRDYGVDALWSDRYCQNLLARGFEYGGVPAMLVTSFEAFEHFVDPAEELDRLLEVAPNVLLSTEIMAERVPHSENWWYYGAEHGQHIGFYRIRTLERMARARGKYFSSNGRSHHLISEKPVNEYLWRALLRVNFIMPLALKPWLKSRIWTDNAISMGASGD